MRISRLKIDNFRSIKKLDEKLPQVCALVGPNNAGKSNILLALQKVLARDWVSVNSFDEDDVYGRDAESDVTIAVTFDPPVEYRRFKHGDPVEVTTVSFEYTRYKIGEQKGQRRLEQKCFDAAGKPPAVLAQAPRKGQQHKYERLVNIPREVRESIPLIYIGTNRSLREQLPSARYSLLRQLFEDIDRELHDPAQSVVVRKQDGTEETIPRAAQFQEMMKEALKLLRTESFEQLEASIKRNALRQLGFDPEADTDKLDFFFSPFDTMDFYKALDLRVREGEFTISASLLGEGIQNALVLAILQAFEERRKQGAILLIEEPEMFLHPQMQRSLYKTIRQIGKTNQVIYATHSPHFVTVPDYDQVVLVRKGSGGTYVRRSDLPVDDRRREKLRKELNPERNELFFASRLLVVEGDTEKLALPEYAKRLKLDLDRVGASIIEAGGKRSLLEFARVASSLNIPTGILYDEDSSDIKDKDEEAEYNNTLDAFENRREGRAVWRLSKKYEDHLRKALGEAKYQEMCQKHSGVSKAIRARLIAMEETLPIPEPIEEVLRWLAKKPAEGRATGRGNDGKK